MSQSSSPQPPGFGTVQATQNSSQPHNMQPSPLALHSQPSLQHPQNMVPPRSVTTPQQLLPVQMPTQVSPNISNQYPFQIPGHGNPQLRNDQTPQLPQFMQIPPPLEKPRFEAAYKSYCNTKGLHHEARLLSVDNRPIDLHSLHVQVMSEGGAAKVSVMSTLLFPGNKPLHQVNQKELWSIIGARMGFVQFPGSDSEPAKSGPGVAQHLAHVYKEYLSGFDNVYIQSVIDSKRKMHMQAQLAGPPSPARAMNAAQMQTVIAYANRPASDVRNSGLPEKLIQYIEANREQLQNTAKMQQTWRKNLSSSSQEQTPAAIAPFPSQQNPSLPQALPQSIQQPAGSRPGQLMLQSAQPIPVGGNNNAAPQSFRQPQGPSMNGVAQLSGRMPRPSQDQLQHAQLFIAKFRQDFLTRSGYSSLSTFVCVLTLSRYTAYASFNHPR